MENLHEMREGRVRGSSSTKRNQEIDQQIIDNINHYGFAGPGKIEERLQELDQEWDVERVLEVNASTLALSGVLLGATKDKRWLILSGVVTTFLLQHGLQGWCPPLTLLRKLGFRTRVEIEEERVSLKALRGDFRRVSGGDEAEAVLRVVRE
jgi:hypothetical protein